MRLGNQLDSQGRLRHLLTLEGMPAEAYKDLFERAASHIEADSGQIKRSDRLRARLVVNAFFEPSTRTRLAFEIASKSLGADVVNFAVLSSSTHAKGESFEDTMRTIAALGADFIVLRHGGEWSVEGLLDLLPESTKLVNGGEGSREHPSQALLDAWTILREKGGFGGLRVAMIGDIAHSRVARSLSHALATLGVAKITVSGPPLLVPGSLAEDWSVTVEHDLDRAVDNADVVVCLRFQYERMSDGEQSDARNSYADYTLDQRRVALAAPDVMVMHPGPINRGVEITAEVADGPRSYILRQVTNGVAMRMAILSALEEGR